MPTHSASAFSKSQLCVTGPAAISGWSHCHLCHKEVLSSEPAGLTSPSVTIYLGVWHVLGCFRYGRAGAVSSQHITSALAGLQQPGWGNFLRGATGGSVWDDRDALLGLAPAGRQAAVGAGRCSRQPAGCAPAPHSTGKSGRERPEPGTAPRPRRRLWPQRSAVPASPEPVPAALGASPSCACSW